MSYGTSPAPNPTRTNQVTGVAVTGGPLTLFTVATGRVIVRTLFGRITTVVGAVATTIKLQGNVAGTDTDLCAASADIQGKIADTLLSPTGLFTDPMVISAGEGGIASLSKPMIINPGTIVLVMVTGGTTGAATWVAQWEPIDAGASLS